MSRSRIRLLRLLGLALLAQPLTASGAPLDYRAVADESDVSVQWGLGAVFDVSPDFTEGLPGGDEFPAPFFVNGNSTTAPSASSKLTADVGLPGPPGSSIQFSALTLYVPNLPGAVNTNGLFTIPLDLTGNAIQVFASTAKVSKLTIVLNDPFSSELTEIGPNEWAWAGLASVNVSGEIDPKVIIPSMDPIELEAIPFDRDFVLPLFGTFGGDEDGTEVTLGLELDPATDAPLEFTPDPVFQDFDLTELGLVSGFVSLNTFAISELTTDVVFTNPTPLPEPGSGALLVGLLAVAALRRASR